MVPLPDLSERLAVAENEDGGDAGEKQSDTPENEDGGSEAPNDDVEQPKKPVRKPARNSSRKR